MSGELVELDIIKNTDFGVQTYEFDSAYVQTGKPSRHFITRSRDGEKQSFKITKHVPLKNTTRLKSINGKVFYALHPASTIVEKNLMGIEINNTKRVGLFEWSATERRNKALSSNERMIKILGTIILISLLLIIWKTYCHYSRSVHKTVKVVFRAKSAKDAKEMIEENDPDVEELGKKYSYKRIEKNKRKASKI